LGCQEVFQSSSSEYGLPTETGPWPGPISQAPTLGRRPEAGAHLTWAETGPEAYNHRSPAPPSILHRSSRWTAWSQSQRNKNRRQPPGSPNPNQSAFDPHPPPHPERVAGRNPMRAVPPRAPAPAPRNHLPQRRRPYQVLTPWSLPSLPPFPTAAAIQHPAAE
jgi:hypothetical protein